MSGFKDECGIFGIYGHPEAAGVTYLGLYALQHRGQEAACIATSGGGKGLRTRKARGYVADAFDADSFQKIAGTNAIGHTRYSTAGENTDENIQPLAIDCKFGSIALCHYGIDTPKREELIAAAVTEPGSEAVLATATEKPFTSPIPTPGPWAARRGGSTASGC